MSRIVSRISSELRGIAGVTEVGAHVGRAVYGDQVVGINSAELWISIDPKANYDFTVSAIQGAVDGYTGMVREVRTYTQQILSQPLRSSTTDDVTLRLYGEDQKVLRVEAAKLEKSLAGTSGVVASQVILPADEATLEIEVDLAAAQKYGIKPGEVRRTAAALLSGILVGNLFQEQKVFDVVVWGEPELRDSISDVLNMPIQTSDGKQVLLKEVADIRMAAFNCDSTRCHVCLRRCWLHRPRTGGERGSERYPGEGEKLCLPIRVSRRSVKQYCGTSGKPAAITCYRIDRVNWDLPAAAGFCSKLAHGLREPCSPACFPGGWLSRCVPDQFFTFGRGAVWIASDPGNCSSQQHYADQSLSAYGN